MNSMGCRVRSLTAWLLLALVVGFGPVHGQDQARVLKNKLLSSYVYDNKVRPVENASHVTTICASSAFLFENDRYMIELVL
jgi:hypothetical protein